MRNHGLLVVTAIVLLSSGPLAPALLGVRCCTSACAGSQQALAALVSARTELLALPETNDDFLDPTLPEAAQRNIERLKDAVSDLVDERMQCAAGNADTRSLEDDFSQALQALPAQCDSECKKRDSPYREIPAFEVKAWPQHRLAIVARISIICGSDALLFVYEHDGSVWQPRIRWRSPPYQQVSGAFEAFDYQVSPMDEHGQWYVLAKSIMPWCSSTWSNIRYAALRPSAAAARVVYQSEDPIWWGAEDFGTIMAQPHEFDVRFHAESMDTSIHNRVWIRHFTIDGDHVERVQPVALTPRDFVDEWIRSDWKQAMAWSNSNNTSLSDWHKRLRGKHSRDYEFKGAQACSANTDDQQIAIADADSNNEYFLRVEGSTNFTLADVSTQADTRCKGEDLLESMQIR